MVEFRPLINHSLVTTADLGFTKMLKFRTVFYIIVIVNKKVTTAARICQQQLSFIDGRTKAKSRKLDRCCDSN